MKMLFAAALITLLLSPAANAYKHVGAETDVNAYICQYDIN